MPGVDGDPARVAAHHLHHHHPVVALGGGVQAVDGVGGDLHRGLEAEREVGGGEVVVDGLGHAHHRDARLVGEPGGHARACPRRRSRSGRRCARARRVSSTRAAPSSAWNGLVRDVPRMVPPRWIRPRVRADGELDRLALDHAPPAVTEPDQLVAVHAFALADDGADHRVEPRTVAAAGEHPDAHGHQCDASSAGSEHAAVRVSSLTCDRGRRYTAVTPGTSRLFRGRHYRQVALDRRARRRHPPTRRRAARHARPTTSSSRASATACCSRCSRPTPRRARTCSSSDPAAAPPAARSPTPCAERVTWPRSSSPSTPARPACARSRWAPTA